MKDLIYPEECDKIIGACIEVYKDKGSGFPENVFQECLGLELGFQQIPFTVEQPLSLAYKGHPPKQSYVADFICYDKIIVELKAVEKLADEHRAQLLNTEAFPAACCGVSQMKSGRRPASPAPAGLCETRVVPSGSDSLTSPGLVIDLELVERPRGVALAQGRRSITSMQRAIGWDC